MNWKNFAIDDLKQYNTLRAASKNLEQRLKALEIKSRAIHAADFGGLYGSGHKNEDTRIDTIAEQKRLTQNLDYVKSCIKSIEAGLAALNQEERRVLEVFYINRRYGHVDLLCEELGCEQARVYKKKDDALKRFTISQYGML